MQGSRNEVGGKRQIWAILETDGAEDDRMGEAQPVDKESS